MTRSLIAVPLALLVLTGCTSDLTGHGAPASNAGGHPTPSPTPTVMTLTQAAAKYQALVAPSNAAGHAANVALHDYLAHPTPAGFRALTAADAQVVDAEQRFVVGLGKARWPATVQPAVHALIIALGGEIASVQRLAAATDPTAYAAAQTAAQQANAASSAKAAALRRQLGIADVPDISSTATNS